jgi:crotonobetainyl-CoA hydratase
MGDDVGGDMGVDVEAVRTRVEDAVLVVTLDRPKANAIDVPTSQALYAAFRQLEDDPTLRCGIITGAGDRFFSAGWDLKAAAAGESVEADHGPGGFAGLTEYAGRTKPVIAAINGMAMGGGFELALAADLIVMAEHAEVALTEALVGVVADAGGVLRIPRLVPPAIARELLLTGRRMSADEALRWGLVNRVVPGEHVLDTSLELAAAICAAAPLSVAAVQELLARTEGLGVEEAFELMRSGDLPAYRAMQRSQDAVEGPLAFAEKRPPRWTGS